MYTHYNSQLLRYFLGTEGREEHFQPKAVFLQMLEQIFYLLDNTMEPLGGPDSLLRRQPAAAEYNPSGTVSAQANQFLVRLPWLDEDFYPATGVDVYEHPFCVERSFGRFCQINVPTLLESTDEHLIHHRFPPDIIAHDVWLYYRFNLTCRDIMLLERTSSSGSCNLITLSSGRLLPINSVATSLHIRN